jgi:hypothetical protein
MGMACAPSLWLVSMAKSSAPSWGMISSIRLCGSMSAALLALGQYYRARSVVQATETCVFQAQWGQA